MGRIRCKNYKKYPRVGFPRARLAISKQAGVKPFKGPQQQRSGQGLINRLLAGEAGVALLHGAEGEVVREGVALFGLWMLDDSVLTVHEDDLRGLLRFLSGTEQNVFNISYIKTFSMTFDISAIYTFSATFCP